MREASERRTATDTDSYAFFIFIFKAEKGRISVIRIAMIKNLNYFYLNEEQHDVKICQYLSLNNFITQLIKKQYYIRRKDLFSDKNERVLPLKYLFRPTLAIYPKDEKMKEEESKMFKNQSGKFHWYSTISKSCFVSSWTTNIEPSNLMWESYASKEGICVISTINNFLASFDNQTYLDYKVYCSPVTYRNPTYDDTPGDLLFVKKPSFSLESEMRFVFLPSEDKIATDKNIWLPYDYKVMIDKVVLSPYLSVETKDVLTNLLETRFDIKVKKDN